MKIYLKKCLTTVWFLLIITLQNASAQQAEKSVAQEVARLEFLVSYVTPEAIYFKGGSADGVRPGDTVWVLRNRQPLMQMEVKYVAEHSATCIAPAGKTESTETEKNLSAVRVNDVVVWSIPKQEFLNRTRPPAPSSEKAESISSPKNTRAANTAPKRSVNKKSLAKNRITGQVSAQALGQRDKSAQRFDFVEPSIYFRLSVNRLANLPVRLSARLRSSQNYRSTGQADMQQQQRALHRVYEIALEYNSPETPIEFSAGRFLRNEIRGLGYLDGIAVGYRLNDRWKVGMFVGAQPEPYRAGFRADEKKVGGFLQMKRALSENSEITVAAAGIGRYMQQQVSREYMTTEVDVNVARQLFITQYLELDLNRQWRRQNGQNVLGLSSAYFNATYYFRPWLSFGAGYDARRLVRMWENRSIADSLFDQSLRQGWRASLTLQPIPLTRISIDGGWQKQKNVPDNYSAGFSLSVLNLVRSGVGVNTRLSYFDNGMSAGYYPAVDLSRSFLGVIYLTAGAGAYIYRMNSNGATQQNPWERLRVDANLTHRFFISATAENFHGDTMKFVRGFIEMGWRF